MSSTEIELVVDRLHDQHRRRRHRDAELDVRRRRAAPPGCCRICSRGRSTMSPMSFLADPEHRLSGGHAREPQQHRLALVGGVLLDDLVEARGRCCERGHDQRGQPGHEGAVEAAERVAEVADGRSEHRADDVEVGRVGAAHLGGPRAGQAAAGVAPQARPARRATGRAASSSARRADRRERDSRVRTGRPTFRCVPRGRAPTPPSPRRAPRRSAGTRTGAHRGLSRPSGAEARTTGNSAR